MRKRRAWILLIVAFACVFVVAPVGVAEAVPDYTETLQRAPSDLMALLDVLKRSAWPQLYEHNVCDCSNMSALLHALLYLCGFDTHILVGNIYPYPITAYNRYPIAGHAMVGVRTYDPINGEMYFLVEATTFGAYTTLRLTENTCFIPTAIYMNADEAYLEWGREFTAPETLITIGLGSLLPEDVDFVASFFVKEIFDAVTQGQSLPQH